MRLLLETQVTVLCSDVTFAVGLKVLSYAYREGGERRGREAGGKKRKKLRLRETCRRTYREREREIMRWAGSGS